LTLADPAVGIWVPVTAALSEFALPYVVISVVEFQTTVEPLTKFVPVTVSVNGPLPAIVDVGLRDPMVGPITVNVLTEEEAALEF
jgi:hypothetical protein